jgi:hypothetical protein
MADIKISQLPVATTVADADVLVVNQGGITKQATRSLVNAASGTLAVANGGTGRTVGNYSIYGLEIHVGKDGNDTTGDGTLINPVLTITKALTLIGSGRNTIVVHPGVYSESPTVLGTNTTITTTELTGANTLLSGTLTLNAAARVSGLKMSNLTITGTGNTYISNCTVDVNVTKSGTNYVEIINSELQCTSGIQITGAGAVSIVGNKCWAVAVSNAAANVLLKDCFQVVAPSVSAGNLQFDGCAIFAAAPTTNAVTSSAGSSIALANSFVLNSAGTNVERVSLLGSYSILNLVYDKANSTLTGTNLNAIDYFSVINADTLNLTNDLSVANGGTGATTAQSAISNLGVGMRMVEAQTTGAIAGIMATGPNPDTFTVTATGVFTVDGYTPVLGDIIAFTLQTARAENGFWELTTAGAVGVSAVFTRPAWFTGTVPGGMYMTRFGTTQSAYVMAFFNNTSNADIAIGSSLIAIVRVSYRIQNATTGVNLFTAYQTFRSNGATANSAPFFFQAGAALMTTPQAHAVEWFNDQMYLTNAAGVRTINTNHVAIPATATSAGQVGQIAVDNANNWLYVCTATNVWKRVLLATF